MAKEKMDKHLRIDQTGPRLFEVFARAQVEGVELWAELGKVEGPLPVMFAVSFVDPFQRHQDGKYRTYDFMDTQFASLALAVDWLWVKRDELLEAGPRKPNTADQIGRAATGRGLSWDQISELSAQTPHNLEHAVVIRTWQCALASPHDGPCIRAHMSGCTLAEAHDGPCQAQTGGPPLPDYR